MQWPRKETNSSLPEEYTVSWRPKHPVQPAILSSRSLTFPPEEQRRETVISDLKPYTRYVVDVTLLLEGGEHHFALASKTGEGTTNPLPSAPPSELTLDVYEANATSVKAIVTWHAPNNTGGAPLTGYLVDLCPLSKSGPLGSRTSGSACRSHKTTSDVTRLIFVEPKSFGERYVAEVRAFVEHDCHTIEGEVAMSMTQQA